MRVVVDTSVWSEHFRRKKLFDSSISKNLRFLVHERRAVMLGAVKQELLSGVAEFERFKKLETILSGFRSLCASEEEHILAAKLYNKCRKNGVQGSSVDFLICAQAIKSQCAIFTLDKDFLHYQRFIPIQLWNES